MDWPILEIATLVAVAVGPFAALYIHGKIEEWRRAYQRRLDIFKTLMATRGATLSVAHVQALNSIDIEFSTEADKPIRDLWSAYLDHLINAPQPPDAPPPSASEAEFNAWNRRLDVYTQDGKAWQNGTSDRLTALLLQMSTAFDYKNLDEVRIKKGVYRPKGHFDMENAQIRLIEAAAATFEGRRVLPVSVTNAGEQTAEQRALVVKILSAIDNDGAYRVRLIGEPPAQAIPTAPPR